jgi:hypothetical protein
MQEGAPGPVMKNYDTFYLGTSCASKFQRYHLVSGIYGNSGYMLCTANRGVLIFFFFIRFWRNEIVVCINYQSMSLIAM